jgi:hemolysin activation/secretion protein
VGIRAGISLPPLTNYVHSVALGIDYKHYDQNVTLGLTPGAAAAAANSTDTPITYYPISAVYSGTWLGRGKPATSTSAAGLDNPTTLNLGIYFSLRGTGSPDTDFDNSRFLAEGNFVYLKGDLSHEHNLPGGFQVFGKVQGQLADQPLVSSEQFAAGGLSSVRGYLEGETPGDNAIAGSIELRSPNLLGLVSDKAGELRVYGFFDAAYVTINDPLPQQDNHWQLASIGAGSRIRILDHFNGSLDAGLPLISQTSTTAHNWLLTFRVWADF